ncbi:uncharacterized protein LOC116413544 isoform X3 [Galleria mellonella]|uniref:Uncharacterized protein LOC116413544 isoform X3 n=1 Tax=Galleria mellonella TaxID=7137 RepID=A0ABM3N799_GALME|nr:uncharacterized protein LOC116413544 isoform X3 [Galleria mellonella]
MGQSVEQSELKSYSTTSGLRNSLDSSFETTGNPPAPQITCSDFGEGSCGEPLLAQHLVIDFSPTEELDNDVVQKKCCAFWKFIRSNPELQTMMKDAKPNHYANTSVSSHNTYQEENVELIKEPEVRETTAVSMLEFVEKKGLIDRTFEARLPQPLCSLGTREYPEDDNPSNVRETTQRNRNKTSCTCTGVCKSCSRKPRDSHTYTQAEVQVLCETMRIWDNEHPKYIESCIFV